MKEIDHLYISNEKKDMLHLHLRIDVTTQIKRELFIVNFLSTKFRFNIYTHQSFIGTQYTHVK